MRAKQRTGLNVVGGQVKKLRLKQRLSQQQLAVKMQLQGWNISRDSLASLELLRRRVPDCELMFLSKALGVNITDLFPKSISLKKLGPLFQGSDRIAVFPRRAEG